jgi:nucleoid-associated protein YgaU
MPESKSDKSIADQIIEAQKNQELEEKARKLKEQQEQRLEEAKQRIRERAAAAKKAKKTYVVQAGDTLGKIAQQVYGDGSRWKEIWEANKDIVPNADRIEVGQELEIP